MVIIDTDIFIAALRGNTAAAKQLTTLKGRASVSIITELELFVGAKTKLQKQQAEKILEPFDKLKINHQIYLTAKRLLKENNTHTKSLFLPDALIAATCLFSSYALLTFNKKDFRIIKNLKMK